MSFFFLDKIIAIMLFVFFISACSAQSVAKEQNTPSNIENKILDEKKDGINLMHNETTAETKPVESRTIQTQSLKDLEEPPSNKNNIKPDPNVELISPPTSLPKDFYSVPQVDKKEILNTKINKKNEKPVKYKNNDKQNNKNNLKTNNKNNTKPNKKTKKSP